MPDQMTQPMLPNVGAQRMLGRTTFEAGMGELRKESRRGRQSEPVE